MKYMSAILTAGICLALSLAHAKQPNPPSNLVIDGNAPYTRSCGKFHLTAASDKPTNFPVPQMKVTLDFNFDPSLCGAPIKPCNEIAFVQILRFSRALDGKFSDAFQPNDEQARRMTSSYPDPNNNGWAVDRAEGQRWAYYARFNDGSWDNPSNDPHLWHIQLGSNMTTTTLNDALHAEENYQAQVIDVPVCMDPKSVYGGKILGYHGWTFARVNGEDVLSLPTEYTAEWMAIAFTLAVKQWNGQDGKEQLQGLP